VEAPAGQLGTQRRTQYLILGARLSMTGKGEAISGGGKVGRVAPRDYFWVAVGAARKANDQGETGEELLHTVSMIQYARHSKS
jgi:hypothetical protein